MWLIGLDDTDMPGTRGTGRLARMLAAELAAQGTTIRGVTRHQLLVHDDVPYTTHNSAACVATAGDVEDRAGLFDWLGRYVADRSPKGSDPGVCLARADRVDAAVQAFGRRAQEEVVTSAAAIQDAANGGCQLAGLAGTEQGVIGALAAVGLRAGGNDGRFIELGRIRQLDDRVRVAELLAAGVEALACVDAAAPNADDWVRTLGWVRPRLSGGRAVLWVQKETEDDGEWVVTDRRRAGQGQDL